jgi:hypothetical protein
MRISTLAAALGLGLIVAACSEGPLTPSSAPSVRAPSFNVADGGRFGQIPTFDPSGTIVIKNDGPCGMLGADENGDPISGGTGVVTTVVENPNKVMLKCWGDNITNLSGSGQNFDGFLCGIIVPSSGEFVLTTDSHATVSASGIGTLTCTA